MVGLVLLGAGAAATDLSDRRDRGPTVAVAVARTDLPAGSVLAATDVGQARLEQDSPLAAVGVSPDAVVGRSTADPLTAGEMITPGRLAEQGASLAGTTVLPVPFPDPAIADYLTPGTVIDVLWIPDEFDAQQPRIVAQDAVVLPDPGSAETRGAGGGGAWQSRPTLLRVADADAIELAAALGSGRLSVLLRSG